MPRVQSADGVYHEFPAGTDSGVIDRVMKDYAAKRAPDQGVPSTPLTLRGEPDASAAPPGFLAGMGHAVAERGMGLAQAVSHAVGPIPETALIPPEAIGMMPPEQIGAMAKREVTPQSVDQDIRTIEQGYAAKRKAGGPSAATWTGEVLGGLAADTALTAPLAAIGGFSGGFVTSILKGAGMGAAGGAITAAATPVTDTNYGRGKARQVTTGAAVGAPVGAVLGGVARALASGDPALVDETIRSNFYKGVRPSSSGRTTAAAREGFDEKARLAIGTIATNKPNLQFPDGAGNIETGRLPQTLAEFGEAIEQTKLRVFQHYDDLAQKAGGQGVTVDLGPAAQAVRTVAKDQHRWVGYPEGTAAATRLADDLERLGNVSPTQAQQVLMGLNERGRGKIPNASLPGSVYQDVAADVRRALNYAIIETGGGGEGYAAARRAYGALKEIENDVGLAIGRNLKNPENKGLWSKLAGVGAIADLLHGNVMQAGGMKLAGAIQQYLASPNRAVQRLFELADTGHGSGGRAALAKLLGAALPAAAGTAGDAASRMTAGGRP